MADNPTCRRCNTVIAASETRFKTSSGAWHEKCLSCFKCHDPLAGKELIEKDGSVYCPKDYHTLFSPRCAECKKPIEGQALKLGSNMYHPECMRCAQCKKQVQGKVFLVGGEIRCESCQQAPADACAGCSKPFGAGEAYIIALDKHWHKDCFVCYECKKTFGATAFMVVDGNPYCSSCNDSKFCQKCASCSQPIRDKTMVKAMDHSFHEDCFRCCDCKKRLTNGFFKKTDTSALCKKCHEKEQGIQKEKRKRAPATYDPAEARRLNVKTEGRSTQDVSKEIMRKQAVEQSMKGEDELAKSIPAGGKFEDSTFPCESRSLYANKDKDAIWLRPEEIEGVTNPKLFEGGIGAGDVVQGGLGDCWFLSALSILAVKPEYLSKLFVSQKHANKGMYTIRFFKKGYWYNVIIDDRIPCSPSSKRPMFAKCADDNELWVMLLEKAYAKVHTCYGRLEGGIINYGLRDLTGGPPETVRLNKMSQQELDDLWPQLMQYEREGFLIGCANASSQAGVEADTGEGILANHAYGVLDFHEPVSKKGLRLLHVRNPWGRCEFTGRYSDYDTENWTAELKRECKFTSADDGSFWMCYEDFCKKFNEMYVTRLFDDSWEHIRKKSKWEGQTAGGCCNNKTWCNNPQFHLKVPCKSEIFVVLTQTDARMRLDGKDWRKYDYAVGFVISKSEEFGKRKMCLYQGDPVAQSPFIAARATSVTTTIEAGVYVIVPSTFNPNEEEGFTLTVYSKTNGDASRMFTLEGGESMDCVTELDEIPDNATTLNSPMPFDEGTKIKEDVEDSDSSDESD